MRVRFSDEALTRLRAIHGYIAEDAPNRADAMIDRLTRRAERIGDVPYAGCVVPEYRLDTLREVLERPYRINLPNQSGRDRNRYSDALPPTAPRKHCVSMCADRAWLMSEFVHAGMTRGESKLHARPWRPTPTTARVACNEPGELRDCIPDDGSRHSAQRLLIG